MISLIHFFYSSCRPIWHFFPIPSPSIQRTFLPKGARKLAPLADHSRTGPSQMRSAIIVWAIVKSCVERQLDTCSKGVIHSIVNIDYGMSLAKATSAIYSSFIFEIRSHLRRLKSPTSHWPKTSHLSTLFKDNCARMNVFFMVCQ